MPIKQLCLGSCLIFFFFQCPTPMYDKECCNLIFFFLRFVWKKQSILSHKHLNTITLYPKWQICSVQILFDERCKHKHESAISAHAQTSCGYPASLCAEGKKAFCHLTSQCSKGQSMTCLWLMHVVWHWGYKVTITFNWLKRNMSFFKTVSLHDKMAETVRLRVRISVGPHPIN